MSPLATVSAVEAFGVRIRIRAPAGLHDGVDVRPPPSARPHQGREWDVEYVVRPAAAGGIDVARGGEPMGRFADIAAASFEIESDQHFRVAVTARDHLFVHAGVVLVGDRALVLPGRTLAGESTLVLALVRTGATYFSDEFAVLDAQGRVHAYRKPLSERVEGAPRPRLHPPETLGGSTDGRGRSLGWVVSTRFRPAGAWAPAPMSRADAVMALFDNTVLARERPDFALERLTRAVEGAHALRGDRGEAPIAAKRILEDLA